MPFAADALGLVAGALTTFAGLPQLRRALRTRSSGDLSPLALVSFAAGLALWLAYGIVLAAPPVILWNAISLLIYLALIAVKVKHLRQ